MRYINIAFYCFFEIAGNLEKQRARIKRFCQERGLKGTIIIAPEGINLMLAGKPLMIGEFKQFLKNLIGNDQPAFKESYSSYIPFNRMLVKVKKQIIPVNDPDIRPQEETAPRLSPEVLKKWLDDKKEIILLDARNMFEVEIGTFEDAKQVHLEHFRDFERNLLNLPENLKKKTIVTFCTGGVRCEKATPIMMKRGFKDVYQLDGGILNYFARVGNEYYKGDCFVFDRRIAVDSLLRETKIVECFNCRHPVTPAEQKLDTYKYEISCPHCCGEVAEHER